MGASQSDEPTGQRAATMSVFEHLKELRARLIYALAALLLSSGVAFYFSDILMGWLMRPLDAPLIFLSPEEALWADLKVALFFGCVCALPVVAYEIWRFAAPGLLASERQHAAPFLLVATLFFFVGIAFCYFFALPLALDFLINYGRARGIEAQISVSRYVDFHIKLLLAFGLIFELPALMFLMARLGWLTAEFLRQKRKYAFFLAFLIAAILTPTPDIFNQCLMAIPIIVLYEIGVMIVRIFGRNFGDGRVSKGASEKTP